jgi:hypothetical protein
MKKKTRPSDPPTTEEREENGKEKGIRKEKEKGKRGGRAKQTREMLWAPRGLFIWHH